ncbi:MAG TPA: TonB-dependent receptor [Ignavibacteriales bacterium]|nr:TonB-dependent receptor [Ignavibacteriales bacterium]
MRSVLRVILLLLLLTDISVFAQTGGKIAGVVKDSRTGEALIGANIVVEGTKMGAASNVDGFYAILNVPPGTYSIRATLIGYNATTVKDVRVNIDQTTNLDLSLIETSLQTAEVVVVAQTPVVQKDVAASRLNLSGKEMENLPVAQVTSMIGLQAGIQGTSFRGGSADQTTWLLNGITLRDERSNQPYTGLSTTAIEEVQVQTGGFSAEYGNVRSGLVNVVTKEGKTDRFGIAFYSRYRPTGPKHFGGSPQDPNAFWMRPFVDPAVAWTGTKNGAWDSYTQAQYPEFSGWNALSAQMFRDNPATALTPQELQKLYLFQHRRNTDINKPDYDIDFSLTGYFPGISQHLGNLRFLAAYRGTREMYVVPLSRDAYTDQNFQLKLTADLAQGMKLNVEGLIGQQQGTSNNGTGDIGMFRSPTSIAYSLSNFSQYKTIENRIFTNDYFTPTTVDVNNIGAKLTHVLNPSTFYEVTLSRFQSRYHTVPGRLRDTSRVYKFGNNTYVDEGPYGFWEYPSTGVEDFRMSVGFSNARDTSVVNAYNMKFDLTSQLNKYNNLKAGFELGYSENLANYGSYDKYLPSGRYRTTWNAYPIRGAVYVKDKLEFEGMIADIGLRVDYSSPNEKWYVINDPYSPAFSSSESLGIDTLLQKQPVKANVTVSPRVAIAFPLSESSKLFFNYGHFRQLPTPTNLYLLRRFSDNNAVVWVANPSNPLPRTIMYELGYEQSLLDEYLVRLSGYYKDVSLQPLSVTYTSRSGATNYSINEPNSYADIRGFEATITKNRGNWVQGFINYTYMVSTSGRFGFAAYNENAAVQREYERQALNDYNLVTKPVPQPYARANVDFFTPLEFGPKFGGIYPLEDWRLSLLASWSSGGYFTWTGGGSIPGVQNNVQWVDYYGMDLKVAKNLKFGPLNLQLFADIRNVLNNKYMDYFGGEAGFTDTKDYEAYMKSLHLPESDFANFPKDETGNVKVPYSNIGVPGKYVYGNDKPGDYRTGEYHAWDENATDAQKAEWRKNKSYIDMPNQDYFTFLNPRDIYWGLRFSLEIF